MFSDYRIPFNRPTQAQGDASYLQQALSSGKLSGDGQFTARCHHILEQAVGVPKALLTTSCTHALEMAALLLDIKEGDEVIVPAFTFVSSANAFVLRGARPVFADIRPDTLCIDERHIERLLTARTRAIIVVHYAGVGCEMDTINALSLKSGVSVIEDNAHGLFGSYHGRMLGSLGRMATLSFHETKNLTCGEGGALLINDNALVERAEIIREKGTDRSKFFRGQVDKYGWVDIGSSYLPSEVLAALLCAQLDDRQRIQQRRCELWLKYQEMLQTWASSRGVTLPTIPSSCAQAYHMFYMVMPSASAREKLIAHLAAKRILAVWHYQPLHTSKVGKMYGGQDGDCPVAERVAEQLVRLPFYTTMTDEEQLIVVEALYELV